jgi:hypothetical protein
MKELCRKGVASHPDAEGGSVGRVLSCEIIATGVPASFCMAEGNVGGLRNREHPADSAQSETPGVHGNSARGNWETPLTPSAQIAEGRLEKALSQKSMHVGGESDGCILLPKCPNKSGKPLAEDMEGRQPTKGEHRAVLRAPDSEPDRRVERPAWCA